VEAVIFLLGFEDRAHKEHTMFSLKRIVFRIRKFAGFGALLLVLFIAPLVIGCSNPSNPDDETHDGPPPAGKWVSSATDYYTITATTLTYTDYLGADAYEGNIRKATYFDNSETSGVIIIEYTATGKPKYWDYDSSWNEVGNPDDGNNPWPPLGNFQAVYFKNRTSTSIALANAALTGQSGHNVRCETTTLGAAISKFTLDAVDDFVSYWGTYEKQ
jgi:hypothetical protein